MIICTIGMANSNILF